MHPMIEELRRSRDDYAWVITKDKIAEPGEPEGTNANAVGVVGPCQAKYDAEFIKKNGKKFRMLDDDGNIYYYGFIYHEPDSDSEDEGFEPLSDFGTPNAGAVHIEYKENEEWKPL